MSDKQEVSFDQMMMDCGLLMKTFSNAFKDPRCQFNFLEKEDDKGGYNYSSECLCGSILRTAVSNSYYNSLQILRAKLNEEVAQEARKLNHVLDVVGDCSVRVDSTSDTI